MKQCACAWTSNNFRIIFVFSSTVIFFYDQNQVFAARTDVPDNAKILGCKLSYNSRFAFLDRNTGLREGAIKIPCLSINNCPWLSTHSMVCQPPGVARQLISSGPVYGVHVPTTRSLEKYLKALLQFYRNNLPKKFFFLTISFI